MAVAASHREVEIKVAVGDVGALETRLRELGFAIVHPRVFEANVIYDRPDGSLRARGELIRIRENGSAGAILTYKGPATIGRHKEREEIEVTTGDAAALGAILDRLGFVPRFRYEKYRTEWARPDDAGILMLDETPVGSYLELEGPSPWIDERARELGYSESEYVHLSYARLYAEDCQRKGIPATDMVFSTPEPRD